MDGHGCKFCHYEKLSIIMLSKGLNTKMFIEMCDEIYDNYYDYSKTEYISALNKLIVTCPKHGEFEQVAKRHYEGHGCLKCGIERSADKRRLTTENFIERAILAHGNLYNYSKSVYISAHEKLIIICKIHGEFEQIAWNHMCGAQCPRCVKGAYSKVCLEWLSYFEEYIDIKHAGNSGELKIKLPNKTPYWKNHIRIDGYCEELNLCFEFDGCLFHGCSEEQCSCSKYIENPVNGKSMEYLREKTKAKHDFINSLGYNLIVIKECHYNIMKKKDLLEEYVENLWLKDFDL